MADDTRTIPYGRQYLDDDDIAAVVEALRSEWLTQGPRIAEFEAAVADYCGAEWGVAFSSGTAALHAVCACLGLGPGDEVVTSPITFLASANAPYHCGARPVFADVEPDTINLSPEALERAITPATRAVIPVHFAGQPCDMDAINALAERHSLRVVADAAHALGARAQGRRIGELAELSVLSFHPVKHITTGEGGMVLGSDPVLRERLKRFRHHDMIREPEVLERDDGPWVYEMGAPGFNYRITDMQCALGTSQLRKSERFLARRRELVALYDRELGESSLVRTPVLRKGNESAHHLYAVRLELARLGGTRRQVFDAMREAGIGCQIHYLPVHLQPFYRKHLGTGPGDCPEAERYYEECLTLPLFYALADDDLRFVCATLLGILEELASADASGPSDGAAARAMGRR